MQDSVVVAVVIFVVTIPFMDCVRVLASFCAAEDAEMRLNLCKKCVYIYIYRTICSVLIATFPCKTCTIIRSDSDLTASINIRINWHIRFTECGVCNFVVKQSKARDF